MKKTNRELAQNVALGFCLSEYPEGLSYDEILEKIVEDDIEEDEEGSPVIAVWQPFEYLNVPEIMEELVDEIERTLNYKDAQ